MKTIVASSMLLLAAAKKSDFPSFDLFHTHCQMDFTYDTDCDSAYKQIDATVKGFAKTDPAQGHYTMKEEGSDDYVWSVRAAPQAKDDDFEDVMFTVANTNDGKCKVTGKSIQAKKMSFYDYEVNFCNLYNVYKMSSGGKTLQPEQIPLTQCKWTPIPTLYDVRCSQY